MSDYRNTPLWNGRLPLEERLDYLIRELTLEEKIASLTTGCPDVERLGIRYTYLGGEAAHGIEARHDQAFSPGEPEPTTSLTQPIGMSGSFDRELIKECGRVVGEEARALFTRGSKGGLCRWAPTVDMERDARWGRTEEAYGEDPCLAGEMAGGYIQGMRGTHPFYLQCGATLKHFYANNVEKDRTRISSSIDLRNKYEYYLEPFRKAVEYGAEAVMTSYNEINGIPAIVNSEIQKLLKDTWGLPGHVVCDGGDFQQTVKDHQYFASHAETLAYGLKAGVDGFTDDGNVVAEAAREALKRGLITQEDIDRSVRNSFRTRIRMGLFDCEGRCPYNGMGEEYINSREHQEIALQMAKESVVLLKNQNGMLPLKPEKISSLAVIGPLADVWYKDWYCGIPPYSVTPLAGIINAYPDAKVTFESGLYDICLICNGRYVGTDEDGRLKLSDQEHAQRFQFTDWGCGSTTLRAGSNGLLVTLEEDSNLLRACKQEAFSWVIRESFRFTDMETGSVDVDVTDRKREYHLDSWDGQKVFVQENGYLTAGSGDGLTGAVFEIEIAGDGLAAAVAAARDADYVIAVIGSNPVINSKEEIDRTTLQLPPAQQRLMEELISVNPDTVAVLITNYPYSIRRIQEKAPAILYCASGSQELGNGIASVLSGETSPAGRLPMTWHLSDADLPAMQDYDIIKGNRTYQYFEKEVLYPFGHGLSYTEFAYGKMKLEAADGGIRVTLPLTNAGDMASDEVVQIYVHKEGSRVRRPISQLKAFERVKGMRPGETRIVTFTIKYEDLTYFDVISRKMLLEEGDYLFLAGASSRDIRQRESIFVKGGKAPERDPFALTKAEQYDDYDNCFIHRGAKGHTTADNTCIIPGKAGDAPDIVKQNGEAKESCRLDYRDFAFGKIPQKVILRICGVEAGKILLSCKRKGGSAGLPCRIMAEKSRDLEFITAETKLPEGFIGEAGVYDLTIRIKGKIKLAEFWFE